MEPSPLEFVSHTHYYCGGDVVVDSSVAIAPGVVLRAAPGASIRIGPGVCVGAGVVIQAKRGCVFIEAGASLGTGVLIVGHGHVGKEATVGPSSTLIDAEISAGETVPPCSLISGIAGSTSTVGTPTVGAAAHEQPSQFHAPDVENGSAVPSVPIPPRTSPTVQPQAVSPKAVDVPDLDATPTGHAEAGINYQGNGFEQNGTQPSAMVPKGQTVYGRDHLNNLLSALFPHRQPLDNGNTGGQS